MNIKVKATGGLTLTPAISDYLEKRIASLDKFLVNDPTTLYNVELAKTTAHHKHGDIFRAEIRITAKNRDLYASSEKEDLYAAIDAVREEAFRELTSSKEKRLSFVRRGGARVKNIIKNFWGSDEE